MCYQGGHPHYGDWYSIVVWLQMEVGSFYPLVPLRFCQQNWWQYLGNWVLQQWLRARGGDNRSCAGTQLGPNTGRQSWSGRSVPPHLQGTVHGSRACTNQARTGEFSPSIFITGPCFSDLSSKAEWMSVFTCQKPLSLLQGEKLSAELRQRGLVMSSLSSSSSDSYSPSFHSVIYPPSISWIKPPQLNLS